MNTKFNCPSCNAAIEADAKQAGMTGDCPACGGSLIVPAAQPQVHPVGSRPPSLPKTIPQEKKEATDYAADAVCATAKGLWKATKIIAPLAGKTALKVITPVVKVGAKVTARAIKVVEPEPPGKWTQRARVLTIIWRWISR